MPKPKPRLAALLVVLQILSNILPLTPSAFAAPAAPGSREGRPGSSVGTLALPGQIEGTVTAAGGGLLAGIDVEIQDAFDGNLIDGAKTDGNGHFLVTDLPLGDYKINFQDNAGYYVPEFYDNVPWGSWENGNNVTVLSGQTVVADAELALGGRIQGTVRNTTGTVLPNISYSVNTSDGTWVNGGQTDINGTYSAVAPAGQYTVQFWDDSGSYWSKFFDNVPHWQQVDADLVTVTAGATTAGINVALSKAGRIEGRVTDASGTPTPNIQVAAFVGDDQWRGGAQTDQNGDYSVVVSPGSYKIQFWDDTRVYGPEFYNDKRDWQLGYADVISVDASQIVSGINASLDFARPTLGAMIDQNWVDGRDFPENTTVTVSINDGAKALFDIQTDENGSFNGADWEYWPDKQLARGDVVSAVYSSTETSMVIQNIEGNILNGADDVNGLAFDATGSAGPLAGDVEAQVYSDWESDALATKSATVAPDGSFLIDFSGVYDIRRGNPVFLTYTSPAGHRTMIEPYNALPALTAHLDHNWVGGRGFLPETTLTVSVGGEASGTAEIRTSLSGDFEIDSGETWNKRIARGDIVSVDDGSEETSMSVQDLSAVVDLDGDKVTGTALTPGGLPLSGRLLRVDVNSAGWDVELATAEATVAADGRFNVGLGGFDLLRGQHVQVSLFDLPAGDDWRHQTRIEPYNALPTLGAQIDHNWIDGRDFPRDTSLTVSVSGNVNADFEVKTDESGDFFAGSENWPGQQLAPGDRVEAMGASMVIQDVNGVVDIATDEVLGTAIDPDGGAPIAGTISVSVQEEWGGEFPVLASAETTVRPTGVFVLYFSGDLDLVRGQKVFLTYTAPNGHRTMRAPFNEFFRNHINLTWDSVEGENYLPGTAVNLAVRDDDGNLKAEAATTVQSWGAYYFGDIGDLRSGDTLYIKPAGMETATVEAELTARVDLAADTISGTSTPTSEVDIMIGGWWWGNTWETTTIPTDINGRFNHSASGDIEPGEGVRVSYDRQTGDEILNTVVVEPRTNDRPIATIWPCWDSIGANGYPLDATITIDFLDSFGGLKATETINTKEHGEFWLGGEDGEGGIETTVGAPLDIVSGDNVRLTVGAAPPVDISVVKLWGYMDTASDTISGRGPADATITVEATNWDDGPTSTETAVRINGAGQFSAAFGGSLDLNNDGWGSVSFEDPSGNLISAPAGPARGAADSAGDGIYAWGLPGEETATVAVGGRVIDFWTGECGDVDLATGELGPPLDLLGGEPVTVTHSKGRLEFHVNEMGVSVAPAAWNGENGWYKTRPTVTLRPDEGERRVYYQLDSTSGAGWVGDSFFDVFVDVEIPDGIHTLYSYLTYPWGDSGSVSRTNLIKVDTVAPTGHSVNINSGAGVANSTGVNLNLSASDGAGSGVALVRLKNEGGAWSGYEAYSAVKAWSLSAGEGTKRVYAQFKDAAGNESAQVFDEITLSTIAPDTAAPDATINTPKMSTNVSKTTTHKVSWSASDPSGIASYDVQYKIGKSGTWTNWKADTSLTSNSFKALAGKTYYWRARAKDTAGNEGPWSTESKTMVPFNENALIKARSGFAKTYSGSSSNFYLGTIRYSTTGGETITYEFTGNFFALIGTKGPKYSKAEITIDGVKQTIDAKAASAKQRQVLVSKTWPAVKKHTVIIKNLGTPGRTRFDVDGLAVGK